ncbi:MAG: hypothetical protein IT452_18145 [Planctomycetia bacterium]|nr:hypothetical protein [Planctomycetia bacterium]
MAEEKLHVTCECGQSMAFRREQAGGRFRCPACKQPVELRLPEEEMEEEEAPRRPAARSGAGRRPAAPPAPARRRPGAPPEPPHRPAARGAAPAHGRVPASMPPPAAPLSPEAARKRKLLIAGGGGGALVLTIVVVAVLALKGPGRPENAGKTSEGAEVWKSVADAFKKAERQDDAAARDAEYRKVLDAVEATRALHDFGWPDFFKGRALSRLGKDDEAKAALQAAIDKLDKGAQAYPKIERGLIVARRHLEALLRTRRFRAGGVSLAADAAADEAAKEAVADLKAADSAKETPFFPNSLLTLAVAEASRLEGRPQAAIEKYEAVSESDGLKWYASAAAGGLRYEADKWEQGLALVQAAMSGDHGTGLARLTAAWGLRRRALADAANKDAAAWLDQAVDLADRAATEGHPAGPAAAASLRLDRAARKFDGGGDGKADLDEAELKASAALSKDSADVTAQEVKAMVLFWRAVMEERAGKDPRSLLNGAIAGLGQIPAIDRDWPALLNRGRALLKLARAEARLGGAAGPVYERATRDFDAVRGNDGPGGGTVEPVLGAATARVEKGIEDAKKGTDATPVFDKVVKEMTAVMGSRPNLIQALEARGLALWAMSDALSKQGKTEAANKALDEALTDLDNLFSKAPSMRVGEILVDAWIAQGEANIRADISPRGPFDNASRHIDTLLRMSPGNLGLQTRRGKALLRSAEFALKKKEDPTNQLATAINDFSAVLKEQPDNLDMLYERGRALYLLARGEQNKGGDSRINLNNAITDLERLVSKDPSHRQGAFTCGDAVLFMGQIDDARGNDPFDTLTRAVGKMEAAVKLDERNGEYWNGLGNAWLVTVTASRKRQKEYGPALEQAERAFRKALELEYWKAGINLGIILVYQRKFDEAEKAWNDAEPKCPDQKAQIDRLRGPDFLGDMKKRLK